MQQLKASGVPIEGIAVRDTPEDVADFLARNGDPYERIGSDPQSEVQIALGSSGVPESFVVDGKGVIRYQHIGPIERSRRADDPLQAGAGAMRPLCSFCLASDRRAAAVGRQQSAARLLGRPPAARSQAGSAGRRR